MSDMQNQADRVRHAYDQWRETKGHSAELFLELMADDVRVRSVLNPPELHPLAEEHIGIDSARAYLTSLTVDMEMIDFPTDQVFVEGNAIVWVGSCHWRHRGTGEEAATPKVDVWHFLNDKAVSLMEMFDMFGFARLNGVI